jgi:hypothetical protein
VVVVLLLRSGLSGEGAAERNCGTGSCVDLLVQLLCSRATRQALLALARRGGCVVVGAVLKEPSTPCDALLRS